MAFTLRLKRGNKKDLPVLKEGEPGFVLDEGKLYIGDGEKNIALPNQDDLDEVKKSVADGKTKVAKAISDKGQATESEATFAKMAENIGKIETGIKTDDATAVAGDVLSGKTAYVKGKKITGTITSRAGGTYTPSSSQQTLVPANTYVTSNVIMAAAQLVANMGGTKRTYIVQIGTIAAGNFVNVEPGITSSTPNLTVGSNITTYSSTLYSVQAENNCIATVVLGNKFVTALIAHASTNNSYPSSAYYRFLTGGYSSGTGTSAGGATLTTTHLSGTFHKAIIGDDTNAGVMVTYAANSQIYARWIFDNATTGVVSFEPDIVSTPHGHGYGTCPVRLSRTRYLVIYRGLSGSNAVTTFRYLSAKIYTASSVPFSSLTLTSTTSLGYSTDSVGAALTNRWVRAVPVSATQVFVLSRILQNSNNTTYYWWGQLLTIGTSSITVAKSATGSFATYGVTDMVLFGTSYAVQFGRYSGTNYIRLNLFTFSASAITLTRSVNITGITNIISIHGLMVTDDILLIVTSTNNGTINATYVKITTSTMTHLTTHTLFTGSVAGVDLCKISNTQVLLSYIIVGSGAYRRILTVPTTSVAKPFTTTNSRYGVAVTGGVVGASISVAEPN